MEYRISEAKLTDLDSVYRLWMDLMHFHKNHHAVFTLNENSKDSILAMLKEKLSASETKVFLARNDTDALGILICRFQITSEAFVLYRKAYIGETMVHNKFQGMGLGKALYQHAEAYFNEKGADHIELQVSVKNPKAIKFWEKRGFVASTKHMI